MATGGEQLYELELILQGQPPDAASNYLGVSPPVRSGCYGGAANPISHVASDFASVLNASQSNLQALRELDSQHSFLRCTGDYRLLLGSPDVRAEGWRACLGPSEAPERSSQLPQQPPESRHLHPFTCRAQYFAVR
ncbi:hypothetical protein HYH03_002120 [Edaphochlamys debaryana]|uniref:Uncharacterized protein n=1 Tax=Edaphochlamys debaryana TaxID=47281 RepID=A0A835YDQ6_9CHLO|nr:hypothetical protein HYH03_002120 [Edaphochlamys debaryana]|eukprot:KAG2499829.1 hypothetical protein HYH03_002120 [Edaphochlamys debaryana]